jgi:hypothetical protein
VCYKSEPDMWYSTNTETQQTIPSSDTTAEKQSDSLLEQTATANHPEKTRTAAAPGSEYWLP